MSEFRRLRTQDERGRDAWRRVAESRPGFATYENTRAGDPSWWPCRRDAYLRLSPVARVMAYPDGRAPVDGETCAKWCGYCHLDRCGHTSPGLPGQPDLVCHLPAGHDGGHEDPRVPGEPLPHTAEWLARSVADQSPAAPDDPETLRARMKPPPADKSWIEMTCTPPRRRWWHRLTRRNP